MARSFAFNQALGLSTLVAGPPFSFAAWVNITATMPTGGAVLSAIGVSQNDRYSVDFFGVTPRILTLAAGTGPINSGVGQPLGTWIHVAGVWASTTSRSLYINGALAASSVTPATPAAPTRNFIGALNNGGADFHTFFGLVAHPHIYSSALTQAQVQADMAFTPVAGLVAAPPLSSGFSPEPDPVSGISWTVTGASVLALDPDAVTVAGSTFSDLNQAGLTEGVGWTTYSYYLQPWKSYLDTWSGQRLLDGIGINFRPGSGNESGTAQVLAGAGFTHSRSEFGWSGLNFADDSIGTPRWTIIINAMKANGLRPLILLNNNLGGICPFSPLSLTSAASSAVGATTITVASTAGIVLGKTGLGGQKAGYQTYPFIKSIAGNVCTLSAPLLVAITSGQTINAVTLKYHPLCTGGLANSFSAETLIGWKKYVTTLCTFVSGLLGNNNFDVEVINEDQSALDDNNFYSPANATIGPLTYTSSVFPSYTLNGNVPGDNRGVLVPATVDVVLTSFPGVRVINGMSNIRPQDCAYNTPPGVTAFSRHNYTNLDDAVTCNGVYGVSSPTQAIHPTLPPTNAILGYDGVPAVAGTAPTPPNPTAVNAGSFFIPSFTLSCPESYVGMGMKAEWMCTDLLPFPSLRIDGPASTIYRGPHGRGGINPISGQTVGLWETETNTDRKIWANSIMTPTNRDTDPASINLWMYAGAKSLLRIFIFYIHKGMQTVCVFADRNINEPYVLSVIPEAFFSALSANAGVLTPAIQALAGSQVAAVTNLVNFITANSSGTFPITPIQIGSVSENSPGVEWTGDGTPAHPDQLNVNNFGVFPFQVAANTYAIAYYVVTHNVINNYGVNGNVLDPLNYQMPDKGFILNLAGMNGQSATVSCYDPLNNTSPPVSNLSTGSSSMSIGLLATDTPRFLLVNTASGTISATVQIL